MAANFDHVRFLTQIKRTIDVQNMFAPHDRVIVGVSGGPDSTALLQVLLELAPELSIHLGIAHVDHCLRGEDSQKDAQWVSQLADNLNLPFFYKKCDVPAYRTHLRISTEDAARQMRYDFFHKVAQDNDYTKIAVGHTMNDNAELVLMYLLRGSGSLGLSGIRAVRDLSHSTIVRPLIDISRQNILDYLSYKNVSYLTDTSNLDTRFTRNKIRQDLITYLQRHFNPNIVKTLHRTSTVLRDQETWLEEMTTSIYQSVCRQSDETRIVLSGQDLKQYPVAARRRVIRQAIFNLQKHLKRISFDHIDSILGLMDTNDRFKQLDLPFDIGIEYNRQMLTIRRQTQQAPDTKTAYTYLIERIEPVHVRELDADLKFSRLEKAGLNYLESNNNVAYLDLDKLAFPLCLRNFNPGDRFKPLGMKGTQKIKTFMINAKIPRNKRRLYPVLTSRSRIIWLVGQRIDDHYKIDVDTRNVLKIEFCLPYS